MTAAPTCRNCGDDLWTEQESFGLCSGCLDYELDDDQCLDLEERLDRALALADAEDAMLSPSPAEDK